MSGHMATTKPGDSTIQKYCQDMSEAFVVFLVRTQDFKMQMQFYL